jgi:hypothetical protein
MKGEAQMSSSRTVLVVVLFLLIGGALACVGGPQKPSVEILSPPSGTQVALGEEVEVEYRATDADAVVRVDLEVGGQVVNSQNSPVAEGQPTMTGVLRWVAEEPGDHTLIVYAYSRDRVASDPVGVTITVGEGEPVPGSTVTISLLIPGSTATPTGTETVLPTVAGSPSASAPSPTRPAATSTSPPPTPTQRQAAPAPPTATPTQPPPTATRTQPPPTATATQPAPTQIPPARIELINYSGEDVFFVHFDSPYHDFGADQLGSDIIPAGAHYNWNVLAGTYHLQAVASDGYVLSEVWSADVHGHYQWGVNQSRQPQMSRFIVFSSCVEPIVYLYISALPGENLVQQGAMFTGESRIFEVPTGQWSFVARDQWDQMLDGGEDLFQAGSDVYFSVCD